MLSYRPTPIFVATLIVLLLMLACTYMMAAILSFEAARNEDITQRATHMMEDWRPDIRHCHHPDVDLWDCIANPGKYKDQRETLLAELRGETYVSEAD